METARIVPDLPDLPDLAEQDAPARAIPPHGTATDTDASWDGPGAVRDAPNDASVLRHMHAIFTGGDPTLKGNYRLPHHAPRGNSAAVIAGVNNALARLNQVAGVSQEVRDGAERHLRRHRSDAGLEESMTGREIEEAVRRVAARDGLSEEDAQRLLGATLQREARLERLTETVRQLVGEAQQVSLTERVVRGGGTVLVKIIRPGWGSSGYYPREVLKRDGPQVFQRGLHMLWDHPTERQYEERPEASLRDLAGVLASDAEWRDNHPDGPGLYAEAQVFEPFRSRLAEIGPHIGVSIRVWGQSTTGEAEGRTGEIITRITEAASVDFVTLPGAGGKVLEIFEAARPSKHTPPVQEKRTIGNWLEARLHSVWVNIVDDLFAEGRVTREERTVLLSAATEAMDAFNGVMAARAPDMFARSVWSQAEPDDDDDARGMDETRKEAQTAAPDPEPEPDRPEDNPTDNDQDSQGDDENKDGQTKPDPDNPPPVVEPGGDDEETAPQGADDQEDEMANQNQNDTEALAADLTAAQQERDEARALGELAAAQRDTLATEVARLQEREILREAQDLAREALAKPEHSLPDITRQRLLPQVAANPPVTEAGELDAEKLSERITQAVEAEREYITKLSGGGRIRGMGGASAEESGEPEDVGAQLEKEFSAMGMTEAVAKRAAQGR